MKRKIERYLSNGDGGKARYTNDGRFNFYGDFEAVLTAVRDMPASDRKKGNSSRKKAAAARSLNRSNTQSVTAQTPSVDVNKTPNSGNLTPYTNSTSRNLFKSAKKKINNNDNNEGSPSIDEDEATNNIFISPPPTGIMKKSIRLDDGKNRRATSQLHASFSSNGASIMAATPLKDNNQRLHPAQTPDNGKNIELRGFTPLSNTPKYQVEESNNKHFADILDSGLISPGWSLGKDYVVSEDNDFNPNDISTLSSSSDFAVGAKTPHASDRPLMCIANVRFGHDSPEKVISTSNEDRVLQRQVNISPMCNSKAVQTKKRQQVESMFDGDNDAKKLKADTPSSSVSGSTITTVSLTVCSSVSSIQTTTSLEAFKVKVDKDEKISNINNSTPDSLGNMSPKQITQDTPHDDPCASPPFSSPPNLDKAANKIDTYTPAEKFWSVLSGNQKEGGSSLLSPTSNSK